MPEFEIIRRYFKEKTKHNASVQVGIGDDAAVLHTKNDEQVVVSVDTLITGVHFPNNTSPFDIGYKSLAVNLSDLAAMGATPQWMTLALTLPQADDAWLKEFSKGLFTIADQYDVALVGGDTTQGPMTISIQIGGSVKKGKALLRTGARPGDCIVVTGTLGDAARGLQQIQQNVTEIKTEYLERLNRPQPRVSAGQVLVDSASACIDISDGLYADLSHVTEASGVGAVIELEKIPLSNTLQSDDVSSEEKYRLALGGGDDYELCFTIEKEKLSDVQAELERLGVSCTVVGEITQGKHLTLTSAEGREISPDTLGYQHFT